MKWIFIITLVLLTSCLSINDRPYDSDLAGSYYRVKSGDKLSNIAHKHRISIEEIMEINGIDQPETLKIGHMLFLPDPDPIAKRIKQYAKKIEAKSIKPKPQLKLSHRAIFKFPVPAGIVTHNFSKSKQKPYDGIGIKAKHGSPVLAALGGKVIFVGNDGTSFGLLAIIEHQEPYISVYTHLDRTYVKVGEVVKISQLIAKVGTSGGLKYPLLHFQIRVDHKAVDPTKYLSH